MKEGTRHRGGRPRRRAALAAAAALACAAALYAAANAADPGTTGDPIALKSYVDEQIANISAQLASLGGAAAAPAASGAATFEVKQFAAGQRVRLGAGAELVVRTGAAVAVQGSMGGMVDLIKGAELADGEAVAANHLLISSRGDGRGVRFTAAAYALVKGSYTVG